MSAQPTSTHTLHRNPDSLRLRRLQVNERNDTALTKYRHQNNPTVPLAPLDVVRTLLRRGLRPERRLVP